MDWNMFVGGFLFGTIFGMILSVVCDKLDSKYKRKNEDNK
jgi:hypothetical protein